MAIEMLDFDERGRRSRAGAKLIDVREPHEWDEAHLEGAIHVPQGELLDRIGEVAPDHSERIVLYCRTDNRSARAADELAASATTTSP